MTNDFPPLVVPASQLTARPVTWLWQNRLARGKLSFFDGDPEVGKSLVTLDLCARITTGRPFPDGAPGSEPANVIILNGEDGSEDTVLPRLHALGADAGRVFLFGREFLEKVGPLRLPAHNDFLERTLADTHAVLLVLDPIMAFFDSSIQIASDMSVRHALTPLARISELHGCHTSMVRHLTKSGQFQSLYRGGGSIGLIAAARSSFLIARDPRDPIRAVLAQIKNNLAPRQPSLAYRLDTVESGLPIPHWLGESRLSADQLLVAAGMKPALPRPRDLAREFLVAFLKAGPRSTIDIWETARSQHFSRNTLYRARDDLKIQAKAVWVNDVQLIYWLLPDQKLPADIDPPDPNKPSLEPWLAPLRAQYPDNPLDDQTTNDQ